MVKLPQHHILSFVYDNEGGCALTALVHGVRFHVIVDPAELKDRSKAGKKIRRQYLQLLQQVKDESQEDCGCHDTSPLFVQEDEDEDGDESDDKDSGISMSVSSEEDVDPSAPSTVHLQTFVLKPLAKLFSSKAPKPKSKHRSVQDWYHCATHFYHLYLSNGKLLAQEDEETDDTKEHIDSTIPVIKLPRYIQKLDVPSFSASDITVLDECEGPDPVPLHPTLVKVDGKEYFLKTVDAAQPGPTKRELQVMKKIEDEGIHNEIRVPLLRGLVHFDGDGETKMMGFLMDAIADPTPLTKMLDSNVSQEKRMKWADDSARTVDLLHQHNIIWGDAKGDNFMVDKNDDLWIIDFGGSYTEGWVDPELKDSEDGDIQGLNKVVNGLHDPDENTIQDPEEGEHANDGAEEEDKTKDGEKKSEDQSDRKRLHGVKRKHESDLKNNEDGPSAKERKMPKDNRGANQVHDAKPNEQEMYDADAEDDEPLYCYCNKPEGGRMLACDDERCKKQWFHFECVGIEEAPKEKKWYCEGCLIAEEWRSNHGDTRKHAPKSL
ncbi:uncharacterized protein MYCFIDRAFT_76586 [Pseudocercospora fijiensis CIRAD86]|uniref:PHD-type domain-containing protein n=1 Tax=Pseudocercospora fijiensis (strain CIRAD86) TaxID=383855 RepID=N1QCQ5_PSEFD|nr:uncharacterized protein MYCFIDRAFT_76586 [Pseudocercospora fijiensis CIRAD86]EME89233.1 hypothetical protein MYCFIDRAFT_76586 [Pseudocercospora fijiensis CIRAD86]